MVSIHVVKDGQAQLLDITDAALALLTGNGLPDALAAKASTADLAAIPNVSAHESAYPHAGLTTLAADLAGKVATNDARLSDARRPAFTAGDGGAVVQATSKSTAVTLNKRCGQVTMHGAALAAAAEVTFQVNNSQVGAHDIPVVCHKSGGTAGAYCPWVSEVGAGYFKVTVSNNSAGSLSQAPVIGFGVIPGVIS